MPPTPRRRSAAPALWIGAATVLVSGLVWAWYSRPAKAAEDETSDTPTARPKRTGPKATLSLAASILPPTWVIERLSEHYNLHLILPAPNSTTTLSDDYLASLSASEFDTRRVVYHETAEGKLHLARVIGGKFVNVSSSIREDEIVFDSTVEELEMERLVRDLASFVQGIVLVGSEGGEVEELRLELGESRVLKIVVGWQGLIDVLGLA